ncbi:7-carboxy-7-deazaguanine synthase QueE [Saccharicrinis fermentans]|uniref:7-carboxy-7-deazaguanine synthase n=1 Tax=Saccharicrinis fermentans DSM 9555 = JCM 21142 TaxID=869213 RepID=W7Y0Y6_9BACT|nr:7-carboxy-7-deazaguanine synthase QueE [Saccharicrinis fermentans]GAF04600.1 7-carboxy-7-deazaguanine synthase [Saccharicrinis fermentans DSM 9555 = JCM 21142]
MIVEEKIEKEEVVSNNIHSAQLVLVGEGVFPITRDADMKAVDCVPNTGLAISGTIQGEGKLAGTPSLFIRLASCNLRCIWQMEDGSLCKCDTSYASFHPEDKKTWSVEEVVNTLKNNMGQIKHVVISGGEPLLQKKGVAALCKMIKEKLHLHITLETNGTIFDKEVAQYIDLFSISPKLSNSVPSKEKLQFYREDETGASKYHHEVRRNLKVLQSYIYFANVTSKDVQLKFVVGKASDADEIKKDYLDLLLGYSRKILC